MWDIAQIRKGVAIWKGKIQTLFFNDERGNHARRWQSPRPGHWAVGDIIQVGKGLQCKYADTTLVSMTSCDTKQGAGVPVQPELFDGLGRSSGVEVNFCRSVKQCSCGGGGLSKK